MITVERNAVNITPRHKVGIKLLTDGQIKNVFPNYQALLEKLEFHRSEISRLQGRALEDYQYNMMYDNVFAILGKRGTGKTSVVFSLQQKLKQNADEQADVVLPIIIPEAIPYDCSVLGWILAIVRDQIVILEEELNGYTENNERYHDNSHWADCKTGFAGKKGNQLSRELDELVELYFSGKYNPGNETSYNLVVGNSAKQATNYYQFTKSIIALWDKWISAICQLRKLQGKRQMTPLIYFIFDDVDLAPEKASELMSVIIKYLSHPNIIVLMTADEEMLVEVIESNLDAKIGKLPKEWREYLNENIGLQSDSWQRKHESDHIIHEAAQLYLGKILPTSTRYYLKLYENVREKKQFCLEEGTCLEEKLKNLIDSLLELADGDMSNFICLKPDEDRTFYLHFFGVTSRQIGNAWLGIENLIDEMKKLVQSKKVDLKTLYDSCIHFLRVVINSNHNLAAKVGDLDEFTSTALLTEHNGWKIYIDYPFLEDFFKQMYKYENKEIIMRLILQVYSLFMFLENILVILEKCFPDGITDRRRIHGITGMSRLLNEYAFGGREMIREDLEAEKYFEHYKMLLERLADNYEQSTNIKKDDIDYFYDFINCKRYSSSHKFYVIKNAFSNNRAWFRQIIEKLTLVYGGLYLVDRRDVEACALNVNQPVCYTYQEVIRNLLKENIRGALDHFDLLEQIVLDRKAPEKTKTEEQDHDVLLEKHMKDLVERLKNNNDAGKPEENEDKPRQTMYVVLRVVVEEMVQTYKEYSLEDLLQIFPEKLAADISSKLYEDKEESTLDILRLLETFIIGAYQWLKQICTYDVTRFLSVLTELEHKLSLPIELSDLIEDVRTYVENYDPNANTSGWILWNDENGKNIDLVIQNIYYIAVSGEYELSMDLFRILREFSRTSDKYVAVAVDNSMFKDVFVLGLVVCAIEKVQIRYLYEVIYKRYDNGHSYSPKKLEYMKTYETDDKKEKKKASKPNSYYAVLFRNMKDLLKEQPEVGNIATIKNYIENVAFTSRRRYINELLREVENEPVSD